MASTSNVIEALRYTYGADRVLYLMNNESVVWNILGRVKKPIGGRGQFLMPITVQNAGVWKGITEGGALPSALQPDTTEASFSLQEFVGMYDVSWKLIQDARTSKFAFQQAIQLLDEGIKRRIAQMINADLIDDGRGRLGILPGADNSSPISVNALPRVQVGQVVDLMDTDNDTKNGDSLTVTAVDPIARTISTSSNPSSTGAGDYFVIEDTCDDSINDSLHMNGLLGVISDSNPASVVGNYGNINRSTSGNEFWKAVVLSNGGTNRALTEDLLLQAMDSAREKGSGMVNAWISNLAIIRRYHEILRADTYVALSSPSEIGGGVGRKKQDISDEGKTPYEFSGVPWHVEPYFAANTIIGLDTSHFYIGVGENEVPRPISEVFDNIPFFRQTSNATFEVAWYFQGDLISDNPAAGVQIQDIAES